MQAGEGRSMVLELLPSTAGRRRDRSQGGAAWTGVAEDPMNLEPVSRPLAVRGRAALVVLVATLLAAGCGKGVVRPIPLPPLSRVVIAQGGDTTVVADTLKVGFTLQFTAKAFDLGGNPVPGAPLAWGSTVPAVFDVSPSGLLTGLEEGEGLLRVEVAGVADTVKLLILPGSNGWLAQVSNTTVQLNG